MRLHASAFAILTFSGPAFACSSDQHDQCILSSPLDGHCIQSICVPNVVPPLPSPGSVPSPAQVPIPFPAPIQAELDKLVPGVEPVVEQLGPDTLKTFERAGGDTVRTLEKAGGDAFATVQKAGEDSIKTIYKAASDTSATYVKAWRDIGEQGKRSFNDAVDAVKAVAHFVENQVKVEINIAKNADKRLRDGKVVDAMWGIATERPRADEENFAKATQESEVINAAAGTAAAIYGGPAARPPTRLG